MKPVATATMKHSALTSGSMPRKTTPTPPSSTVMASSAHTATCTRPSTPVPGPAEERWADTSSSCPGRSAPPGPAAGTVRPLRHFFALRERSASAGT